MNERIFYTLAVLITTLVPGPAAADIAIGFANPLSGPFAASGMRNRTAVFLAVEDLNARGGVLGQAVQVDRKSVV